MIAHDEAQAALARVRELVTADGGDLLLAATGIDSVRLTLVLDTAECAECVMPRPFLETVALDLMRAELPSLATVQIDDPRE